MDDLLSSTKKVMIDHEMVRSGDHLIAGVSGGPDSMALLAVLYYLRNELGFNLSAAHLHHGLRAEANADAALVRQWCEQRGIDFFEQRVDLAELARVSAKSIEEAGRDARRSFFDRCRNELKEQVQGRILIALGHHRQDQAETVIFNLARGSGLSGICGMKIIDPPYIRPFLLQDKTMIIDWLKEKKIPWQQDHTNFETVYTRNRIRHILLPCWQETIGYDPVPTISRASENLAIDNECLEQSAMTAFKQTYSQADKSLKRSDLLRYHKAVRVRVLKLFFLERAHTVKDLDHRHIELLNKCLETETGPFDLPYNFFVRCYDDKLLLADKSECSDYQDWHDWAEELSLDGRTELPGDLGFIEAISIEYNANIRYNSQMNCFRADSLRGCQVRFRRPGDHIRQAGRKVTKTLKKFMNEAKIDPRLRDRMPVIASGNDIAWVPGYACGEDYICNEADKFSSAVMLVWHRTE